MAAFGISGGILSLVYSAFFYGKVSELLLFLSLVVPIGGALTGLVVNVTGGFGASAQPRFAGAEENVQEHFAFRVKLWYALCITLAVYVLVASLLKPTLSKDTLIPIAVVGLVLVASVCLLPIRTGPWIILRNSPPPNVVSVADEGPFVGEDTDDETPLIADALKDDLVPEFGLRQLFTQLDFYLLFFIYFAGAGPCIATSNNMFSIVMSKSFSGGIPAGPLTNLDFPEESLPNRALVTTFVAIFSAMSTLGRLGFGLVSDKLQLKVNRSFWLVICVLLVLCCQIGMVVTDVFGLYALLIFMGTAYGGFFALVPAISADRWGEKNFGLVYGIVVVAPALGSLLFSTLVAGVLSDSFGASSFIQVIGSDGSKSKQCTGPLCYRYSFITYIVCLAVALLSSLYLWWKTRRVKVIDETALYK